MSGKHRRLLWLCLMVCTLRAQDQRPPVTMEVTSQNGDRYTGSLINGSEENLKLKPYWAAEPVEVAYGNLLQLKRLGAAEGFAQAGQLLVFPSGKRMQVKSLALDADGFMAGSMWGQEVRIPRGALAQVMMLHPEGLLYAGPEIPGEEEGEFVLAALPMERPGLQWESPPLKLPERFVLDVEIETPAEDFAYQINLFDWKRRAEGSVVFEVTPDLLSAAWYHREDRNRMRVKNWRQEWNGGRERQHFRLYADVSKSDFRLWMDGKEFKHWQGGMTTSVKVESDNPLGIRYTSGDGEIRIASVRVMPWDGTLPDLSGLGEEDVLLMSDGRRFSGKLQALNDEGVRFLSKGQPEPDVFPQSAVLEVLLAQDIVLYEKYPPRNAAKLHVMKNPGELDVVVDSLDSGKVNCSVWTGGQEFKVSIPLEELRLLTLPEDAQP